MPNLFRHPVYTNAMKLRQFYVYIMTNARNTTTYIGVTNDLLRRVYEHKQQMIEGFTKRYQLEKLVYYEVCDTAEQAITREKQLKNWHRNWKHNLIAELNPEWRDLYDRLAGMPKQVRHDALSGDDLYE